MYSTVTADREVSVDITKHCTDDYNIRQAVECSRERPKDVQSGEADSRQGDGIHGRIEKC